jgi:hypothetical protein
MIVVAQGGKASDVQPTTGCRKLEIAWSPSIILDVADVGGDSLTEWPRYCNPKPYAVVYVVDRYARSYTRDGKIV